MPLVLKNFISKLLGHIPYFDFQSSRLQYKYIRKITTYIFNKTKTQKTYPYDIIRIGLSILIFTYYFQNYTSTHT